MNNLNELCKKAHITAPIMKKYQNLFKIGKGQKVGGRTYYSDQEVSKYKRIKQLRVLGFSYNQIKNGVSEKVYKSRKNEVISFL